MSIDVKEKREIDKQLKEVIEQYLDVYHADALKVVVNVRRNMGDIKVEIADIFSV